jgi:hypothetical protein
MSPFLKAKVESRSAFRPTRHPLSVSGVSLEPDMDGAVPAFSVVPEMISEALAQARRSLSVRE